MRVFTSRAYDWGVRKLRVERGQQARHEDEPGEARRLSGEAHDEERREPEPPAARQRRDDRERRETRRRGHEDGGRSDRRLVRCPMDESRKPQPRPSRASSGPREGASPADEETGLAYHHPERSRDRQREQQASRAVSPGGDEQRDLDRDEGDEAGEEREEEDSADESELGHPELV